MRILRSGTIEAVEIHYFVPCSDKVVQKLFLGVLTSVHFRHCSKLGIRTENKIDAGRGPLERARPAIVSFKQVLVL